MTIGHTIYLSLVCQRHRYGETGVVDNMPTSMQAALLKYSLSILLQIYKAYFVYIFPTLNWAGNHPWLIRVEPPTARITFLNGIKLLSLRPMQYRCLGPPRQIVAPLSGKIFNWVLWLLWISSGFLGPGLGENGTCVASISTTLFLLDDIYEPASLSNSTCAIKLSMLASSSWRPLT